MKTGDWALARAALDQLATRTTAAADKAARQEAQLFRTLVVRAFNTGGRSNGRAWPRLKPRTIRRKGSSRPLIDSAQLRNSVAVIEKGDEIFVGIASNKKSTTGKYLVSIAAVHEYGKLIARSSGGSVWLIRIPERSFIRSTAERHFKKADVRNRMLSRIGLLLGDPWARQVPKATEMAAQGVKESRAAQARTRRRRR